MKFLKIEVELYENGKIQYRVLGRNTAGMVAIGLTKPVEKKLAGEELSRVVKEMEQVDGHVPHISPLGEE